MPLAPGVTGIPATAEQIASQAGYYVSAALPDLPGMANTDARVRWHSRRRTARHGSRPRADTSRGTVRLRLEFTIAADRAEYAAWSLVAQNDARSDLIAYVTSEMENLPALANAKVRVRWSNRNHRRYWRDLRRDPWPRDRPEY